MKEILEFVAKRNFITGSKHQCKSTVAIKQKNGYYTALQINNVWYEYTSKKNKIRGKKAYLFINTKGGKKEVLRDSGDYYIKSEEN